MPDLRVKDFSGGETDRFRDGHPSFCQVAKNMNISENKGLVTRPGFAAIDDSQIDPFGATSIGKIWHHRTRRPTNNASGTKTKYETFVSSRSLGAVRRYEPNEDVSVWKTVSIPADNGGSSAAAFRLDSQGNYVRLNDNEFVLIADDTRPLKFFREDELGEWKYVSLGLPRYDIDANPLSITEKIPGDPASITVSYAFVLKHTYTLYEAGAGTLTKIVRGAPAYSIPATYDGGVNIEIPSFERSELSKYVDGDGVQVDAGAGRTDTYYEYSDIEIELYRTDNNGSIYYLQGTYAPTGPLEFGTRIVSDISFSLSDREQLYTNGGVVGNDMSNDRIRYATYANDSLWLSSTSRVWQSKVGIFDAIPGSFQFNVREGEFITGINTIDIYPIVFTNQGVYRIEGIVDDLGRGTHRVRTVSEDYGGLSNKTTIKAKKSIFFWSDDGIYETNGYQAMKASDHYDERYNAIVEKDIEFDDDPAFTYQLADGCYDEVNQRITWGYTGGGTYILPIPPPNEFYSPFLTQWLTMHLKYKHEEGYAITSGDTRMLVSSLDSYGGNIYAVTEYGAAIRQYSDVYIDTDYLSGVGALSYLIAWQYISCSLSFGTSLMRKWFSRLLFNFKKHTDIDARLYATDEEEDDDWIELNPVSQTKSDEGQWFLKRWFKRGRLRGTNRTIRLDDAGVLGQKVEMSGMTIIFSAPGEGHTESDRT